MKIFVIVSILLVTAFADETRPLIGGAHDDHGSLARIEFEDHMEAMSTKRHPKYYGGKGWLNARAYVKERMYYYGLRNMVDQEFNTTVGGEDFVGVNLIGLLEPNVTSGPVIVVGADYDSGLLDNPLKDNGGGVAVLLETVNLFCDRLYWHYYDLNATVVFVAFDLNTKELSGDEMGKSGSYYFLHNWLIPYLHKVGEEREFLGAIILDSVTTYNARNDTQVLRDGFDEVIPDADAEIKENGLRGDFLGFLYTSKEKENPIRSTFVHNFQKKLDQADFRLQEMELHLSLEVAGDEVIDLFDHQSHYYFWTNTDDKPMPAFLLFDTDDDRMDPTPEACDSIGCSVDIFLTKERKAFMTRTTEALVYTLLDLQATHNEHPDNAANVAITDLLVTIMSLLAFIIMNH